MEFQLCDGGLYCSPINLRKCSRKLKAENKKYERIEELIPRKIEFFFRNFIGEPNLKNSQKSKKQFFANKSKS